MKGGQHNLQGGRTSEKQQRRQMTITTQRTTANSPAQAAKNRVRGPTVAARRRGAVDAARFAASRATGAATARPGGRPRNEAKRWASGKSRKTGFAKARATFRGGGRGSAAAAERHDSMMTKARWRGTEAIARETPAGSLSVASMPQRKDYTNDAEHHGKFQVWLQAGSFQGKARDGAAVRAEHAAPLGSHVWLSL